MYIYIIRIIFFVIKITRSSEAVSSSVRPKSLGDMKVHVHAHV